MADDKPADKPPATAPGPLTRCLSRIVDLDRDGKADLYEKRACKAFGVCALLLMAGGGAVYATGATSLGELRDYFLPAEPPSAPPPSPVEPPPSIPPPMPPLSPPPPPGRDR